MAHDCSRKSKRCDKCRAAATRISPSISSSTLLCGKEIYPLVINCAGKGTEDQVCELISRLQSSIRSNVSGPIRVAVRRAASNGKPAGKWRDFTGAAGFGFKATKALMNASCLIGVLDPEKVITEQFPEKRVLWQDRVGTMRDISILADFTSAVMPNGDFEQIVRNACGEIYRVDRIVRPNAAGHASLHRLQWFAMVSPEEDGAGRAAVTITRNGYVRKRKR
ncbi:hypothetical protein BDV06DRAFT_234522 [Aspergillus oleicola]